MGPDQHKKKGSLPWDKYKGYLKKKYIHEGSPLATVKQWMKQKFRFDATDNQYKKKFSKWGFRKNARRRPPPATAAPTATVSVGQSRSRKRRNANRNTQAAIMPAQPASTDGPPAEQSTLQTMSGNTYHSPVHIGIHPSVSAPSNNPGESTMSSCLPLYPTTSRAPRHPPHQPLHPLQTHLHSSHPVSSTHTLSAATSYSASYPPPGYASTSYPSPSCHRTASPATYAGSAYPSPSPIQPSHSYAPVSAVSTESRYHPLSAQDPNQPAYPLTPPAVSGADPAASSVSLGAMSADIPIVNPAVHCNLRDHIRGDESCPRHYDRRYCLQEEHAQSAAQWGDYWDAEEGRWREAYGGGIGGLGEAYAGPEAGGGEAYGDDGGGTGGVGAAGGAAGAGGMAQ